MAQIAADTMTTEGKRTASPRARAACCACGATAALKESPCRPGFLCCRDDRLCFERFKIRMQHRVRRRNW